jgi:hypothetical protein
MPGLAVGLALGAGAPSGFMIYEGHPGPDQELAISGRTSDTAEGSAAGCLTAPVRSRSRVFLL